MTTSLRRRWRRWSLFNPLSWTFISARLPKEDAQQRHPMETQERFVWGNDDVPHHTQLREYVRQNKVLPNRGKARCFR
jgi:hypothetical protein